MAIAGLCLFVISLVSAPQVNAQTYEVNDVASFRAAVTSINDGAGGATIKITGDFEISGSQITIKNDVTITAETNNDGTPKYTITGYSSYTTILCQIKTYCTIENLILINGNGAIYIDLLDCETNVDIKINNCIISDTRQNAILINTSRTADIPPPSKIIISNCKLNSNSINGIMISGDFICQDVKINNCILNSNSNGSGTGIQAKSNANISNCKVNSSYRGFVLGTNCVVNNCTANSNNTGFELGSNCVLNNCTASTNGTGFRTLANTYNEFNDCIAIDNTSKGYYCSGKVMINSSIAENNGDNGFFIWTGGAQVTNCLAIGNTGSGFNFDTFSIVNNCSAISNSVNGFTFNNLKFAIISNSTAAYNKSRGFSNANFITNCTAYDNETGIYQYSFVSSLYVYNSISYNNKKSDLGSAFPGEFGNNVYQTIGSGGTSTFFDCTTDDPCLIGTDGNGIPTNDSTKVRYYTLKEESSALGLANKSLTTRERIIDAIPKSNSAEDITWIENIVTEEYVVEMLMFDQRGIIRSFEGDRYDAGSISGSETDANAVYAYFPKNAANYGRTTITFYGNGFDENTEITLKKQGESNIIAEKISPSNTSKCLATFNLHNKKTGKWDIIANLQNTIITIKEGFEIEEYIEPEIELKLLNSPNIRNGSLSSYIVEYSNKGNVSVYCLPVIVEITTDNDVVVEVKERWDYLYTEGLFTDKYAEIDGVLHKLDTLHFLTGENQYTTFVTPLVPVIPPYGKGYFTFDVRFKLEGIADNPIDIKVYALNTLVVVDPEASETKSLKVSNASGGTAWGCMQTGADIILDIAKVVVPGAACGIQVAQSLTAISSYQGNSKFGNTAYEMAKIIAECASDAIPGGTAAKAAVKTFKALSTASDIAGYASSLSDCANGLLANSSRLVGSKDPNDKIGPISESGSTWISDRKEFTYVINFENDSSATAPTQEIWVTDILDLNVFDINSFEAGIMKIGDRMILDIPFNTQNYTWSIDMRPEIDIILKITLKLDKSKGIATWYFKSIDPATGNLPADALLGFLPPNDDEGSGQGFVMFTIKLKDGLPDDVTVANSASIVFDLNDPIITPEWVNQRDIVPPTSTMLRPINAIGEVELAWLGEDNASGVYCYDIYMKRENEDYYEKILSKTKATSTVITIEDGVKYSFYSIAYDNAGNREMDKTYPDITIPFDSLPFDTYCVTKWNNTFMLNLKKLSEDGYDITDCEWFKNNISIGEGFTYSAGPKITDQLVAGAVYFFRIITTGGDEFFSTYKILDVQKTGLRAYPNPVPKGHKLTVEGTTQGSFVEVYNYQGICVSKTIADEDVTELTLAVPSGIYIISSNNEVVKVVIK